MNAEIITVGTELLLGDITDTNSQFLSRELAEYGINMLYKSTVGDNTDRLGKVLSLAMSRSDLVVITGGLGPTADDLTRETVSEALGIPLEFHEESWRRIEEYFAATGRECTENNRKQAMLPENCVVFPNDHGTAPGCAVEKYGQCIVMLPGPPKELIPMFSDYVAPYLASFAGGTIFSRTVGIFGLSESALAERLADLMSEANPTVAPYADGGEVVLRVTAHAANVEAAQALCDPVVEEIRRRLGVFIYGVDAGSLQKAAVSLLRDKELKIATAESCTAGLLSGRITEIPGASSVFECGIAAYSKEIKRDVLGVPAEMLEQYGAVSPEVACAMAIGARRVGHADLGVGITGVAGPEASEGKPVGTVYIALADEKRTWVKKITAGHGPDDREAVRYIATSHALDLVRRYLEALPAVMAGGETVEEPASTRTTVIPKATTVRRQRFWSAIFPHKGEGKAEVLRKLGLWTAFLLLVAAAVLALYTYVLSPVNNQHLYDDLRQMYNRGAQNVSDAAYPGGMLSQFYSLYSLNNEVKGWVRVDDTKINYPVVQGEDDLYYRNHSFDKKSTPYGAPFFNSTASFINSTSDNRNLIIYGNNTDELLGVSDGQMFSELVRYADKDMQFLKDHPVIEMNTVYRNADWKIFGVMLLSTSPEHDGNFEYARTQFTDEEDFLEFVEAIRMRSLFTIPVEVKADDSLLMLSTNAEALGGFEGARLVVVARRVRVDESAESDLSTAASNDLAIMPDIWMQRHSVTRGSTTAYYTTATTASASAESEVTEEPSDTTGANDPDISETTPGNGQPTVDKPTESRPVTTTKPSTTVPTEPTSPTPSDPDPDLKQNSRSESEYMLYFQIQDAKTGQILKASTPADLQYALSLIVKMEMGNARTMENSMEAHKAQAVASYSYVINYVYGYGQPYRFTFPSFNRSNATDAKIYNAVGEVLGVKLLDMSKSSVGSQICTVQYFAYASESTANNNDIYFNAGAVPYLRAVSSPETAADVSHYTGGLKSMVNSCTVTWNTLQEWLPKQSTINSTVYTDAPSGSNPLRITATTNGGYVTKTNLYYSYGGSTKYVSGNQIRNAVNAYYQSVNGSSPLCSPSFSVDYDAGNDTLTFTTKGWGHGVGMSQIGAVVYANQKGWNYKQILSHYFSVTGGSAHQLVAPNWGSMSQDSADDAPMLSAPSPWAPGADAEPARYRVTLFD